MMILVLLQENGQYFRLAPKSAMLIYDIQWNGRKSKLCIKMHASAICDSNEHFTWTSLTAIRLIYLHLNN